MITFEEAGSSPPLLPAAADSAADETVSGIWKANSAPRRSTARRRSKNLKPRTKSCNPQTRSSSPRMRSWKLQGRASIFQRRARDRKYRAVLICKVAELDNTSSELQNLLNSTQIATIFLDLEMRVKNFTPAAGTVFRLIPGDVGRPITDFAIRFAEVNLVEEIKDVLGTLAMRERQVNIPQGQHYQMRILPYRTVNNAIEGVVLTFLNVTQIREAEQRALRHRSMRKVSSVKPCASPCSCWTQACA